MTQQTATTGMLCPVCKVGLVMTDRQGVEIDYCPQCRGVWLDRGELDKIIERNAAAFGGPQSAPASSAVPHTEERRPEARRDEPRRAEGRRDWDDDDDDDRYERGGQRHGKRRRGGFLDELFDFG